MWGVRDNSTLAVSLGIPSLLILVNWTCSGSCLGTFFVSHIYRIFLTFDRKVLETFERVQNNRN